MLWQEVKIHLKEIYCELTVDVVKLIFVVAVKVWHWGVTAGTGAILRDIAFFMSGNRLDLLVVPVFKVGDEKPPVPFTLVKL